MGVPAVVGQQADTQRVHRDTDGQIDEKYPVPAQRIGQQAAEQHAYASATGAHEAIDPHRLGPLARFGEQIHDQRQRNCGDDCAAQTLHRPRGDEQRLRVRHSAGRGCEREQGDAEQEQPAMPIQIAQSSAEQQEAAERDHVCIDHPDQRGLGKAEIVTDRWQGDIHDGRVEHDHQHAGAKDIEREPALVVADSVACLGSFASHVGDRVAIARFRRVDPASRPSLARSLRALRPTPGWRAAG